MGAPLLVPSFLTRIFGHATSSKKVVLFLKAIIFCYARIIFLSDEKKLLIFDSTYYTCQLNRKKGGFLNGRDPRVPKTAFSQDVLTWAVFASVS